MHDTDVGAAQYDKACTLSDYRAAGGKDTEVSSQQKNWKARQARCVTYKSLHV